MAKIGFYTITDANDCFISITADKDDFPTLKDEFIKLRIIKERNPYMGETFILDYYWSDRGDYHSRQFNLSLDDMKELHKQLGTMIS